MEENQTFIIVDEEGAEHQAVIVYKIEPSDEGNKFGKSYIFYYVEDESDEEDVRVYVASIDENAEDGELGDIETPEEQEYIEDIFNNLEENTEA
ncbi:hypothetical protein QI30_13305 [Kurthia sp. 3B1D]|uniref:UPF0473 protein QI30_13305 n=2 Tax=Kurthia TaxID=1649 RepID=A0A433RRZ0_9BACL|nr:MULTISPECIES: DUF1292 domain-containing protein [unclassified Kurthia]RUS54390.1 hypothetical protein QI30_13305 [Kurthia sp. 3B1D]HIX43872.1 DUF1292 domain-containing protein [Candidatus Kurthia intestinigallinarum]